MFAQAQSRFSQQQLAELVLTIGFYMMVSRFLENYEVDIEAPGTFD
jgi:alkylhydroperoxidase family enzyme